MQRLGQHFLKNKSALKSIVDSLEIKPQDIIIEIGPGHGELTNELRSASPASKIIAIERDEKLHAALSTSTNETFETINGDALKVLPDVIAQLPKEKNDYKLAGNIPYYITGHLFRLVSELEHKPKLCVFTIQKEVAERIVALPPKMNRLAASVQYWAEPKIIRVLSAKDFSPAPKVDSAIILFATKDSPTTKSPEQYYDAVRTIFAQPRKTILNNLLARSEKAKIIAALHAQSIDPSLRPQDLQVEEIGQIAKVLF